MGGLGHPLKEGGRAPETAILSSNDGTTEHVKWNAPSFHYAGEDKVTFRLFPKDRVQLVFHRGAKVKGDAASFSFDDHTGLLRWVANDRVVVALRDAEYVEDMEDNRADLVEVVNRWVVA